MARSIENVQGIIIEALSPIAISEIFETQKE